MELTLADYAKEPKPLVAGVAKALQEESPLMDSLTFVDTGTLNVKVIREGGLPAISWRKAGSPHGSTKASTPVEFTETAFSFGNWVDVDKVYIMDKGQKLYDPRTYWTEMTAKAMAREFNHAFIEGNPVLNPDRPTGLRFRIANDFAPAQTLTPTALLDISPDSLVLAAATQQFFDLLDQLHYAMDGHKADLFVCNDTLLLRFWSLARQSGLLKVTTDNIGREFYEYKGAKFVPAGFMIDDATQIIGNTEILDGSAIVGGTATSIYAAKLGAADFTAWQEYALEVEDLGRLDDGVTYRTQIDWVVGLAATHSRSLARLTGLVAA